MVLASGYWTAFPEGLVQSGFIITHHPIQEGCKKEQGIGTEAGSEVKNCHHFRQRGHEEQRLILPTVS
jgi:hypothetical protein